jgi:hypothetical protein
MPTACAEHFIVTDAYRAMLDRIMGAVANPGHDLRTELTEIIGDAGIWPDYCRPADPAHEPKAHRAPQAESSALTF